MGAARYRWFHEYGCCECIGSTCLDFGKGEALCLKCSATSVEDDDDEEADTNTQTEHAGDDDDEKDDDDEDTEVEDNGT